jgi:hypothetical protein
MGKHKAIENKKAKRLKAFSVETHTDYGTNVFCTKAKNGKEALSRMLSRSADYKHLVKDTDSNNMRIEIKWEKTKQSKTKKQ